MSDDGTPEGLGRLRHDLRTPLTIVIGFAEIMAAEHPLSDEQRRDLSAARAQGGVRDARADRRDGWSSRAHQAASGAAKYAPPPSARS